MDISIMIEGQDGLNWRRWQRLATAVEALGFKGLYRSDHYTNAKPPDKDSLELWVSLTWLASHTKRIEFGPLVSPVSFRQPTMTARMAGAVDDLSNGRLRLGLGAGWQEREHANYGWDLLELGPRMKRFEEGLHIISQLLHSDNPVQFEGEYYTVQDAILLPRPGRRGGPPIIVGGNGEQRTLPLAAQYAQEWNGVFLSQEKFKARSQQLDALLAQNGREPGEVRRSLMTACVFATNEIEVEAGLMPYNLEFEEAQEHGFIVGMADQIVEQLGQWAEVGLAQIILQWLDMDDVDGLEAFANAVLPQVS